MKQRALPLVLSLALAATSAPAQTLEDFTGTTAGNWRFISDQVMGGVSQGRAGVEAESGETFLRLTGTVSTENRGGFIQARRDLPGGLPTDTRGVALRARGDGQRYFLHLRTTGTVLPWQYYQAPFTPGPDWGEIRVPLSAFTASGSLLRNTPRAGAVRSIALVAYGRDHLADVSLTRITLY
ncbi:CIA30 family protein [Aquicoccus sp. SU-CL01552]|uniref:CIA30 family protein n=1 Tax=Aquicoccus sp. SU-CL01552 TaxID=3127656 RepID=UPI003102F552